MAGNGGSEAAECDGRRDFGGGKGAALGTQQERKGWMSQGVKGV